MLIFLTLCGLLLQAEASRQCSPTGSWAGGDANDSLWTHSNYTQCLIAQETVANAVRGTPFVLLKSFKNNKIYETNYVTCCLQTLHLEMWVPVVKRVAQLGYSVSLFTLIAAFIILLSIK